MEEKKQIRIYHTHIEVYPYKLGENKYIEKLLSVWIDAEYRFDPIGFHVYNDVLYVPRGFNIYILQKEFNTRAFMNRMNDEYSMTRSYSMLFPPKNRIQEESIDFLTGEGEFKSASKYSQQALILDTGDGKTYATINSIIKLRMRAIIITHQDKIKMQWINTFIEKTNVPDNELCNISGSDVILDIMTGEFDNKSFYFVNHQTLQSYGKQHGWDTIHDLFKKMGIGIKVFDEAHKEYTRTLFIDYVTNVKYTFYLTATFQLSNYGDNQVFQRAFNIVPKLKIKSNKSAEHIIYLAVLFNSRPNTMEEMRVAKTKRGSNRHSYIAYEMEKGILAKEVEYIMDYFINQKKMKGKSLILSPKKSSCDYFKEVGDVAVHGLQSSCSFYTGNKVDNYKHYDIISATAQMLGTGEDIPELRFMHNTEPIASLPNTDQFSGRLRPFYYMGEMKDTYYIEYIDIGFEKAYEWYKNREKLLKKKVKEVKVLNQLD